MRVPGTSGRIVRAAGASGGRALLLSGSRAARTRLRARRARPRSTIVVRARSCRGAPRIVATIDGRTAIVRRVAAGRWTTLRARTTVRGGTHTVAVRVADRLRTGGCRRGLLVDRVAFEAPARPPTSRPARPARAGVATGADHDLAVAADRPARHQSVAAQMYDIDLFENSAERGRVAARRRVAGSSAT